MVDRTALEMRHACKGIGGSNPPLSARTLLESLIISVFEAGFELCPECPWDRVRPHSALANRTPEEFRQRYMALAEANSTGQNFTPGFSL